MKAMLFLLLSLLLSFSSYSQDNSQLTPFKILELNLSSLPQESRLSQTNKVLELLAKTAKQEGISLPKHQLNLGELGSLPAHTQSTLNIALLNTLKNESSLRETFFKTLYLQNIHTPSPEVAQLYSQQTESYRLLHKEIQKKFGNGLKMENLFSLAQEMRGVVFDPENFKSIPVHDGFEFTNKQMIPESVDDLKKLLDDSQLLINELDDLAREQLSRVSEYESIKDFNEYKEYVDASKLSIGGEKHSLGKAKKTFINVKTSDGDYKPVMISKVVLHNSEDAFIYLPEGFDIDEPNFQNYLLRQHSKAATTYDGFKDMQILKDEHINKNTLSALMEVGYGVGNSEYRLKKNISYWKARFKSFTLTGRNLYIVKSSGEIIYSPQPKLFSADYWKSGKGFQKFKRIIYAKPENWPFALIWGGFSGGVTLATKMLVGGTAEEALLLASTVAIFSTVFTAHVNSLQNATKGFTPLLNKFHNLMITSATFGALYLLGKNILLHDATATLNIFGSHALHAWQNIYDILIIGIVSKHFSEPWKIGTDMIKETRSLRGSDSKLGIKYGRFQIRYQSLQLIRGTFKNIILSMALGGAGLSILGVNIPEIPIGDFTVLKPAMWLLPITSIVGAAVSVGMIKKMQLLEKSPKSRIILERNTITSKTYDMIDDINKSIKSTYQKVKSGCNRLFGKVRN